MSLPSPRRACASSRSGTSKIPVKVSILILPFSGTRNLTGHSTRRLSESVNTGGASYLVVIFSSSSPASGISFSGMVSMTTPWLSS